MNKAQPWNINGVGFDAREAAREAARRQGKSLGEWLHGVIADHAEDHGLPHRAIGGQERIDAVTARLEQMGARPGADHARRGTRTRPDPRARLGRALGERDPGRFDEELDDEDARAPRAADRRPARAVLDRDDRDDGDDLLESAVAAMERRTARTERRTDQALASMAKLLEETQARRDQEYGDVAALTRKLGELESNLAQRFAAAADNPIKGSLARLEARLDAIGKRGAAEASARQSAVVDKAPDAIEPIRRLEDKLNTILEAVQPRAPGDLRASPAAMAAVQAAPHAGRRSLGDAIADISRRQRVLEEPADEDRPEARAPAVPARRPDAAEAMVASLRGEMASLAAKVDDMRRDALLARQARPAARDGELDALRADLGGIARTLGGLAPRGSIDALETSIATLAERVEASREHGIRESVLRPVEAAVGDLRHSLHRLDPRETIGGLEEELRRIGDKVDGLSGHDGAGIDRLQHQMEELRETVAAMAARPLPIERIERQVAILADRLDHPFAGSDIQGEIGAATDALRAMIGGAPAHLEKIETRLDMMAGRLDQALAYDRPAASASSDTRQLEQLVRDLGLRFEAAQAPGADGAALDSLQRQVEQLSERFERSETGLSALPTLAASMSELFSHLEATRASVETSAARTAHEVFKIAADEGRHRHDPLPDQTLRALQDEVEARTSSTLTTVQDMLGKVVDRLAVMEHQISDVRQRPVAVEQAVRPETREMPAAPARPKAATTRPVIGEPREIRLGGMEPRPGSAPAKAQRNAEPPRKPEPALAAVDAPRADFIAAARRAAATAQAEAAAAQRQAPSEKASRAGLLVRSRDYVATHKRPVLMSIAALMMALGVIALMDRTGGLGGGVELASRPFKAARVASLAPAVPAKIAAAVPGGLDNGALTPSALPKTAAPLADSIPGSDPIQTGSIPSLPSFAAAARLPPPPPRPALPQGLVAAAEGGDATAQYDLANRYAEGRLVPRDMKLAASWFEKAANAGSAPAQYRLASLYEKGIGVGVDKVKARTLYTKAADAGNPRAMHNLAVLLADGDGHPDYAGALGWFRKAAQYGVHDSQYNLAVLLARGLGASQSLVQSYQWFSVAGATGDTDAQKKRDEVGLKLSANDIAVAKALAASFQPRVADPAAVEVAPPPGGWDGASGASRLNSARSKISSL